MIAINISSVKTELQTLIGDPIHVIVQKILWDDETPGCLMYIDIEPKLWPRIWADGLFQIGPKVVFSEPVEFDEENSIEIELELNSAVFRYLLRQSDPIEALLHGLGGSGEASEFLRNSASWRARIVVQNVSVPDDPDTILQMGFKTIWAE